MIWEHSRAKRAVSLRRLLLGPEQQKQGIKDEMPDSRSPTFSLNTVMRKRHAIGLYLMPFGVSAAVRKNPQLQLKWWPSNHLSRTGVIKRRKPRAEVGGPNQCIFIVLDNNYLVVFMSPSQVVEPIDNKKAVKRSSLSEM
uniref:Uncharacterized protein n=1 Tax=Strigamia maritima TaxID=126957 RepID=T1JJ20_STRMM